MLGDQKGFSLIELVIVLLSLAIVVFIGVDVVMWHKKIPSKSTPSTPNTSSQKVSISDIKTEQDLVTLNNALESYANNSSVGSPSLPSSLSQLNLGSSKLNYSVTNYSYSIVQDDEGAGPGDYYFDLCGKFQIDTFSLTSFNNYENNYDNTIGDSPGGYDIHAQGTQCYQNGGGAYADGFGIVLNKQENQIINSVCNSDTNSPNWCGGSSYY